MTNQNLKRKRTRGQAGITLIEMLVVMTIIALFAALVAPNMMKHADAAKVTKARADLQVFVLALASYKLHRDTDPRREQGLAALRATRGDVEQWAGPYLKQD